MYYVQWHYVGAAKFGATISGGVKFSGSKFGRAMFGGTKFSGAQFATAAA